MLQINNSPAFTGVIYNGDKAIAHPNAAQDNNMLQAVTDELVQSDVVTKSEVKEGEKNRDTRTNYAVGDRFEIMTVVGYKSTSCGGGGVQVDTHALKELELGYENADGDKLTWKFEPAHTSERLRDNLVDLLTFSENNRGAIKGFMNALKGVIPPGGTF